MGFFKKIFKPVSRVLDKVIPNEIKPALPFAAAFAPYLLPTGIMGAGVAQRALMGGGLNILGQLSQEGNEGDINLLSAGLGALTGAMTAPGTAPTTARGDLMCAQAKRDQDEYDRMMEEEAAAAGEDSAARAFAIRQAMEAYGFSEDEIVDAIAAAGYKKGGRVGFEIG